MPNWRPRVNRDDETVANSFWAKHPALMLGILGVLVGVATLIAVLIS